MNEPKLEGPSIPISIDTQKVKYLSEGEDHKRGMSRIAQHLADDEEHFRRFYKLCYQQKFLPAGRIQSAAGAEREVTAFNCFVSDTIPDSFEGIMEKLKEAGITMRLGGGIGYDFSTLRPRGATIKSLDSKSSGPLSFMDIYDALCTTIASAGHRRGAQMGVLRVDHPDIEAFVEAKCNRHQLTQFNISVGATDEFMNAVVNNLPFDLRFEGKVYKTVDAYKLYERIMRATYDWAEPGVLFLDTMNKKNNLWFMEKIVATNPCGR